MGDTETGATPRGNAARNLVAGLLGPDLAEGVRLKGEPKSARQIEFERRKAAQAAARAARAAGAEWAAWSGGSAAGSADLTDAMGQARAAGDLVEDAIGLIQAAVDKLNEAQGIRASIDPDGLSSSLSIAEADLAGGVNEAEELQARLDQPRRAFAEWSPS